MSNYVIITPANNEAAFIEQTIAAVIAQTVRPLKWVIVNDASTDQTREIVESHARQHNFIELVNVQRAAGRHFGNKVRAFNTGLERVKNLNFDFIGNLDADISFAPDYFSSLLKQFEADPKLGLAGGMVHTSMGGSFVSQNVALDSVAGAVQLFRRKCFEQVGSYLPLPNGGEDSVSEVVARMNHWKTRTFTEYQVHEHRLTGSATAHPLMARSREGARMYSLGYSSIFFLARCIYRFREKPILLGSCAACYGFFKEAVLWKDKAVTKGFVRFLRAEQCIKLKRLFGLHTS